MQALAQSWEEHVLDIFDDCAWGLCPGDAYTLSGCPQTHFVIAVDGRAGESHTNLLVYLPDEVRVTGVRIRPHRLMTVQRPRAGGDSVNPATMLTP